MNAPASTRPVKLRLDGVTKTFRGRSGERDVVAVERFDAVVHEQEFVSIVGPSGCGKSTLLHAIAGLTEVTSGRISVDGEPLPAHARRRLSAYMFQRDLLLSWRRIRDNVALGLELEGVKRSIARRRAVELLERFGLAPFALHYPTELSGGMRQRVALMRTLLCDREILLLDEPFASLDALTRTHMQEWLLSIWSASQRTVVFITHDIDEAIFLSDRVLVMTARPGRLKAEIPIELPRPRDREVMSSSQFVATKHEMLQLLHEEVGDSELLVAGASR